MLETIANRVANASNKDRPFGLAVCKILQKFKLPDADIVDRHDAAVATTAPRCYGMKSWPEFGAAVHTGYFKPGVGQELMTLEEHLLDILLRIVFKLFNYEVYHAVKKVVQYPVDWVTKKTRTAKLA